MTVFLGAGSFRFTLPFSQPVHKHCVLDDPPGICPPGLSCLGEITCTFRHKRVVVHPKRETVPKELKPRPLPRTWLHTHTCMYDQMNPNSLNHMLTHGPSTQPPGQPSLLLPPLAYAEILKAPLQLWAHCYGNWNSAQFCNLHSGTSEFSL